MKRLPLFMAIFGILLAVMGAGIPIYSHFCDGNLDTISIYTEADNCCSNLDEPKDDCHLAASVACHELAKKEENNTSNKEKKDCCNDNISFVALDSSYCIPDCGDEIEQLAVDLNQEAVKFATQLLTYIQNPSIDDLSIPVQSQDEFVIGNQSVQFEILPRAPGKN